MIRKIICLFVVLVVTACLAACSPNTVSAASSGSLVTPTTTESAASSSAPLETPTNTASEAGSGMHEPSEAQQGLPKNDNIIGMRGAVNLDIPANIPANPSVNYAWDGRMCEAGGSVYYVSDGGKGNNALEHIARMNADRSQGIPVTSEYKYIYGLTADDKNLYFMASKAEDKTDAIFALSLNGGDEKQLTTLDGEFYSLQAAGDKLYWEKYTNPDVLNGSINIICMNPDGTDEKQLLSIMTTNSDFFRFLSTSNGLYYSCPIGQNDEDCTLFHTDLQGQNKIQLNKQNLGIVDTLFYDQNNLYFTTLNIEGGMSSTVNRLDKNGLKSIVIKRIDYFPQDEDIMAFYGVSGNIFYYFNFDYSNSDKTMMDLHTYDIVRKQDEIIAKVDIDDSPVLHSIRGKVINIQNFLGLYILGNDLYYTVYDPM